MTGRLLGLALGLSIACRISCAQAQELSARVMAVEGDKVTVRTSEDQPPSAGDRVEIYVIIPGLGEEAVVVQVSIEASVSSAGPVPGSRRAYSAAGPALPRARCRRKWSARTTATMASATGTTLGHMQGSCRFFASLLQ